MKLKNMLGGLISLSVVAFMAEIYISHNAEASVNSDAQVTFSDSMITLPKTTLTLYDVISDSDFQCLVQNVYFEARGESALAQRAVAWVTMNRVFSEQFPNSVCGVVHQARHDSQGNPLRNQCQFSWYCDGKSDTPTDAEALAQAEEMTREVLVNYFDRPDPTEGSVYFHADYVSPSWRRSFNRVVQIDKHIFYNLDEG